MSKETVSSVQVNLNTNHLTIVYDSSSDDVGFRKFEYQAENRVDLLNQLERWRDGYLISGLVTFLNDSFKAVEDAIGHIKQPSLF